MGSDKVNPEVIKKRMWLDYQYAASNPDNERLDSIHKLINTLADSDLDLHTFLQNAADTVTAKLWIKEATIGLRSQLDGLYRYEVMSGLDEESWEAHKKLSYGLSEFSDTAVYKFMQISRFTRLFLAEDNPYDVDEEPTFHRELMLQSARKSLEDTIEGDYLDIWILGKDDELLGWIEISGLKNGKFPDIQTIKCVELLASVIGVALTCSIHKDKTTRYRKLKSGPEQPNSEAATEKTNE